MILQSSYHQYARDNGFRLSGGGSKYETICPQCQHGNRKFYINIADGLYYCFHCKYAGKWSGSGGNSNTDQRDSSLDSYTGYQENSVAALLSTAMGRKHGLNYLINTRKLDLELIKYLKFGYDEEHNAIVLPTFTDGVLTGIERRAINPASDKERYYTFPGSKKGIYNADSLRFNSKSLVICEGIFDTASFLQLNRKIPSIGITGNSIFNKDWGKLVDKYEKIYLLYDMSPQSDDIISKWLEVVPPHKCYRPLIPAKDVNDLLTAYPNAKQLLQEALDNAGRLGKPLIASMREIKDDALAIYSSPITAYSTGFQSLDNISGGIRPGELSILMGGSGLGKSTLSAIIAINVANQGVKTMIGSFELSFESEVLPKIVSYLLKNNIEINKISVEHYNKIIEGLHAFGKLVAFNRAGITPLPDILAGIEEAYDAGARFIILDHLHYFIKADRDERLHLVGAMKQLKALTRKYKDLSIMMVVHPSNPPKDFKTGLPVRLTMYNSKGSSDIYQEADNFWTINYEYSNQTIDLTVDKLRSDKTKIAKGGKVQVLFDKLKFQYTIV